MQVQQEISRTRLARKVGTVQRVLVDQVGPTVAVGRTAADAPEIDGVVYVKKGRRRVEAGGFVDAAITGAEDHDLHGRLA
jgi:ribosomal protein S12 methylthiotransferase